jgi:amino-acid N-acetyltransferase
VLVRRGRERLEMEISRFHVMEHDGRIIGCAALYPFPEEKTAELACMAVHHAYRRGGRGDRLLQYCESIAKEQGLKSVFVLTTHTEHWFEERGFIERDVNALPQQRQQLYNLQRRSKVFTKQL